MRATVTLCAAAMLFLAGGPAEADQSLPEDPPGAGDCWTARVQALPQYPVDLGIEPFVEDVFLRYAFITPGTDQCSIRVTFRADVTSDDGWEGEAEFFLDYPQSGTIVDVSFTLPTNNTQETYVIQDVWNVEATARPGQGEVGEYDLDKCYNRQGGPCTEPIYIGESW
ncbi:hypothetical protein LX15_001128 [Streptoalloteichus tenebrarius]|uniref:Secreted protein n=1 Tax=Streptoalloteichus tenebrarius (strain ATCC 17920 / DSM 40477 / JCM 4838 / CBS 697.72 / NBRC 16177 / NCIMB 11028 / NRRL B-12390 / A12253. 1 / ISP 5477) TaxID=1933 RepID=A0ABT1HPM9_STRSD|nr:hypothetical protein [Streptoalloteichus tenebrarius]MCP2257443.1 hypothetical protein [Streptoalloteichus tenebrarius]BFE98392.1 hypothetical protein GCM10020241_00680 [Streptoalloteichus tenebrarius]